MMMNLTCNVLSTLKGKTLATAESCTGGGIGAALTSVPGSSAVYVGGVVSYTNDVKERILGVSGEALKQYGAVSEPVARSMASGVRKLMQADIAVSVTGLAGPDGDEYGNPVGTVFLGYEDMERSNVKKYFFSGDRDSIRMQAITAALQMILEYNQ